MEVHLPLNQETQFNELPTRACRGTGDLVQEAISKSLADDAWLKAQVQIGIDRIKRGAFIEQDDMDARVERLLQPEANPVVSRRRRRP